MPGMAETGAAPASWATVQPLPASGAVEEANVAGAGEAQPAGTDRPPTAPASPSAPAAPAPETELTRAPSPMTAPPASGVTESARATAAGVAAASVWPSEIEVGMAFITNHAEVLTAPLKVLKNAPCPRNPSIEFASGPRPRAFTTLLM